MFNSYSNNSININAVSGTIVKNYRKSFILRFHMKSSMAKTILSENPRMDKPHYIDKEEPVVVLQVMLCGDEELLAEVMWKSDFDELFKEESEDRG